MALKFITASERLAEQNLKTTIAITGPFGIGKTTLALQIPQEATLFLDIEAGMKAVEADFMGVHIPIRTWQDFQDIAVLVGGPDPAASSDMVLSQAHYDYAMKQYGGFVDMNKFQYLFIDSISDATQLCGKWAEQQPEARNKYGVPDTRGRYGLVGRESVSVLKHLQRAPAKSIIYVGKLEQQEDETTKKTEWRFKTEGGMARKEIPFIVDTVVTYDLFDFIDATGQWLHNPGRGEHRCFVCRTPNPWGLPAKNRSRALEMIEEPHLGKLIDKINEPSRITRASLAGE